MLYLQQNSKSFFKMTAIEIRRELDYELTKIPDIEPLLFRILNYVKDLKNNYIHNATANEDEAMKAYENSLSQQEREAVYEFVDTIKKRVADVENANKKGETFGRKAEDFLAELKKEAK